MFFRYPEDPKIVTFSTYHKDQIGHVTKLDYRLELLYCLCVAYKLYGFTYQQRLQVWQVCIFQQMVLQKIREQLSTSRTYLIIKLDYIN